MYIELIKPYIIFVTETKLSPTDVTRDYFNFKDYTEYRYDRTIVDGGGGVIILVHNNISSEPLLDDVLENTESAACIIKNGSKKLLLGCIYRKPSSPPEYNTRINNVIRNLSQIDVDQTLICGDFNYPKIDWNNHIVRASETSSEQLFYDECQNAFLHQHVDEPTRQRGSDKPSLIDLVLTKNEFEIDKINFHAPIGLSDHSCLAFEYELEGYVEIVDEPMARKKYFKADYTKIKCEFGKTNWTNEMNERDLKNSWELFSNTYDQVVDSLVPVEVPPKGPPKNKWMTRCAQQAVNRKAEAWDFYRKKRTKARYERYCRARNNAVQQVRLAKFNFEKSLANEIKKGDTAAFYSYLRSKTKIKDEVSKVTKPDGNLTESNKETGNIINNTFQAVYVHEGIEPIPQSDTVFNGTLLAGI